MKSKLTSIMFGLILFGGVTAGVVNFNPLGDKPAYLSSFMMGDVNEDEPNVYVVRQLANVLETGKNRQFDTFVQTVPIPGHHDFYVVMSDKHGTLIKSIHHGAIDITATDHVHTLLSVWITDITAKEYVSFTVVDMFQGKRYNIASFKILVE
jgi:hypothetical protein